VLLILAAILALLLLSAFFSGSETALTAASRSRMHHLEVEGEARARLVNRMIMHKERLIGALLLGNNLVNILASALATSVLISLFGEAGVVYATIAMTLLIVIFGEILPKTYAIRHADRMALAVAPAVRPFVAVLAPLTGLTQLLITAVLRGFGVRADATRVLSLADELRGTIDLMAREGTVRRHYRDMLRSILDLSEIEVGEIMVHRKNMFTIDADQPMSRIVDEVMQSPHTRVPLWRGEPDNIVGIIHAKNMLRAVRSHGGDIDQLNAKALATEPWFVPDTTSLAEQLAAFRSRREHVALVVDEYGALQGLVTLEDILEEIVGEIADEHDRPSVGITAEAGGAWLVDGGVSIRDLNRALDWRLPDEEAATVAGLVIHEAQQIPEVGQRYSFHGVDFEVIGREANRITRLRLKRALEPPAEAG